jgi:hypothetical protein
MLSSFLRAGLTYRLCLAYASSFLLLPFSFIHLFEHISVNREFCVAWQCEHGLLLANYKASCARQTTPSLWCSKLCLSYSHPNPEGLTLRLLSCSYWCLIHTAQRARFFDKDSPRFDLRFRKSRTDCVVSWFLPLPFIEALRIDLAIRECVLEDHLPTMFLGTHQKRHGL